MNLPMYIAGRYLRSRSSRGFASLVTTVSFFGLVLGVVSLLVVVSVMNGFDRELKSRILGAVPHLVVHGGDVATLSANYRYDAISSITPFQEAQLLVATDRGSQLVAVHGLRPELEEGVSTLPTAMVDVDLAALLPGENSVVLGASVVRRLGLVPGDAVNLVLPTVSDTGKTLRPKLEKGRFIGSFTLGSELDYRLAIMHLDDLSQFAGEPPGARITLDDIYQAPRLSRVLRKDGYEVEDWTERYGDFFATVRMEKIMMFIVLTFVIAVASFSIVAGLSMLVDAKRREIAVLRTMGMCESDILRLFFVLGSMITSAGVSVGLVVGLPLAFYAPDVMAVFEAALGFSIVEGTYFDRIPTDPRLFDIVMIVLVTTLIGCLATLSPARRAARLAPAQILRYD